MEIRRMELKDIKAVVELEKLVFGQSLGEDMLTREISQNEVAFYFVGEEEGRIIGYLGSWQQDGFAEIVNFLISPDKRNLGYGSRLLQTVFEQMQNNKVEIVTLEVRQSNIAAIGIYEKFGFFYSHTRSEYYENKENALVLVKKMEVDGC